MLTRIFSRGVFNAVGINISVVEFLEHQINGIRK